MRTLSSSVAPERSDLFFSLLSAVDAWHKKGFAGGMVIPPMISPTRRMLFPLLSGLTAHDLGVYPL